VDPVYPHERLKDEERSERVRWSTYLEIMWSVGSGPVLLLPLKELVVDFRGKVDLKEGSRHDVW
jgi:hypothetical protein